MNELKRGDKVVIGRNGTRTELTVLAVIDAENLVAYRGEDSYGQRFYFSQEDVEAARPLPDGYDERDVWERLLPLLQNGNDTVLIVDGSPVIALWSVVIRKRDGRWAVRCFEVIEHESGQSLKMHIADCERAGRILARLNEMGA